MCRRMSLGSAWICELCPPDQRRQVFNRTGSPAVIVQPQNAADIATAIRFARDQRLVLSIRSGGHGIAGQATNDSGLVIDLACLNQVEVLDAAQHRVRIGAGTTWGEAAEALAAHGLAISSGDTRSVGVGGLTLGGGIGWMVRKYGLTIDHLEGAELVTANGEILHVSANEHPDLFWAIRGGGGNFGVATAFEFRAQPISSVISATITYDVSETQAVLTRWRDAMRAAPEELTSMAVVFPGFGEISPQIFVIACYAGDDEAAGRAAIQPLLELGNVQQQDIQRKPYHTLLEEAPHPPGMRMVSEAGFIRTLSDDLLATIPAHFGRTGAPILQLRSLGGAMARLESQATAFPYRDCEAIFWSAAWTPLNAPSTQADDTRRAAWDALKHFRVGTYLNFLSDASQDHVAAAYPPATYARLASIKAKYDPDNVFNQNHNIKPAVGTYA
jgi:FAD/FMN-containing dehydrogenase